MSEPIGFTVDTLSWKSWVGILDIAQADAEQIAILDESNAQAKSSEYYLTLIQDAPALQARSRLFNAVMYGPKGLPRAEREFASTVESVINGCPYCASVHGRLFGQLTKEPEIIEALFEHGVRAAFSPRLRAIADYAEALTASPPQPAAPHIKALREQGLSDHEILDLTHAVAMFAWANRLMQTLGEPVRP